VRELQRIHKAHTLYLQKTNEVYGDTNAYKFLQWRGVSKTMNVSYFSIFDKRLIKLGVVPFCSVCANHYCTKISRSILSTRDYYNTFLEPNTHIHRHRQRQR
jgi:hypothetical protein